MTSRDHPYTVLTSRYLWESHWYNVRQDQLRAADGREFTYTLIESPGAVWIIPITASGDLVLINQYRYTIAQWCLEVPAGNIETGIDPVSMALRELREEIGGTAEQIVPVAEFFTMNGIGTEVAHIYAALGVTLGESHREPTELIELVQVPLETGLHMARTGQIKDGPSALAILLSESIVRSYVTEQHT